MQPTTSFIKGYPQDLSNLTKIGRIVTFLVLTFGLSTIFYVRIITGGEGIEPWVLPLMCVPRP